MLSLEQLDQAYTEASVELEIKVLESKENNAVLTYSTEDSSFLKFATDFI